MVDFVGGIRDMLMDQVNRIDLIRKGKLAKQMHKAAYLPEIAEDFDSFNPGPRPEQVPKHLKKYAK
jgi:hypothetical protein